MERAKDAVAGAMPSARRDGTPLAEAVHAFERSLGNAKGAMRGWKAPDVEVEWQACSRALDECLAAAERLRLEAPPMDFEAMALVLGDLIAPLDAFAAAHRALRRRFH